jgi:large subunit ribosomal protein L9
MEVILLKDVDKLGTKNDLVNVKNGYGRNYLIPQGYALLASESMKNTTQKRKEQEQELQEKAIEGTKAMADTLAKATIKITAKAGEKDKLFGAVTAVQVAEAIEEQTKIKVDKKAIILDEDIKMAGKYTAKVKFDKDIEVEVSFEVTAEKAATKKKAGK